MTQNATVKKSLYNIIIAQFVHEGTLKYSVQLLSQYSAVLKESSCMELKSMQIIHVI